MLYMIARLCYKTTLTESGFAIILHTMCCWLDMLCQLISSSAQQLLLLLLAIPWYVWRSTSFKLYFMYMSVCLTMHWPQFMHMHSEIG
jgi:hypothetical protein